MCQTHQTSHNAPLHGAATWRIDRHDRKAIARLFWNLCRVMLCISAAYAVAQCLSVCPSVRPSVTFVDSVETNRHIFKLFHRRVAMPFWFFYTKRHDNIRTGTIYWGIECRWGRQKSRFLTNIWLSDRWLVECEQLRRSTVQFTAQTATHQRIFVYHKQHGRRRRRREENRIY